MYSYFIRATLTISNGDRSFGTVVRAVKGRTTLITALINLEMDASPNHYIIIIFLVTSMPLQVRVVTGRRCRRTGETLQTRKTAKTDAEPARTSYSIQSERALR